MHKKALIRLIRREIRQPAMAIGYILIALAVILTVCGGWKAVKLLEPSHPIDSDTLENLEGKLVTVTVEDVFANYVSYGMGINPNHQEMMEFIYQAEPRLFFGIRCSGEKMLTMYRACENDGTLESPVKIKGRLQKMDPVSEKYYNMFIDVFEEHFGTSDLQFAKYIIIDESYSTLVTPSAIVLMSVSAVLGIIGTVLVVSVYSKRRIKTVIDIINNSPDRENTAEEILDFWKNTLNTYSFKISDKYVAAIWKGKVQLFERSKLKGTYTVCVRTDKTNLYISDGNKTCKYKLSHVAAREIMNEIKKAD